MIPNLKIMALSSMSLILVSHNIVRGMDGKDLTSIEFPQKRRKMSEEIKRSYDQELLANTKPDQWCDTFKSFSCPGFVEKSKLEYEISYLKEKNLKMEKTLSIFFEDYQDTVKRLDETIFTLNEKNKKLNTRLSIEMEILKRDVVTNRNEAKDDHNHLIMRCDHLKLIVNNLKEKMTTVIAQQAFLQETTLEQKKKGDK